MYEIMSFKNEYYPIEIMNVKETKIVASIQSKSKNQNQSFWKNASYGECLHRSVFQSVEIILNHSNNMEVLEIRSRQLFPEL